MNSRTLTPSTLRTAVLAALGATAIGVMPSSAQAQQGDAPQVGGLEEILVTARKRAESVQDVPVAVTAVTAAMIDRYDLTSLERLASSMPQLNIGRASNGSGAQITLRGIGSQATSIGLEQSTAIIVDGVYYGQGRVINEAFFDLERIEVLKGPQALYYGKNSPGGVVSIRSADPTNEFEAMVRVGYEFEAKQAYAEGVISGPVSDAVRMRLAVRASKQQGYFHNTAVSYLDTAHNFTVPGAGDSRYPGETELAGRLTVIYQPNDAFSVRVKAFASKFDGNAANIQYTKCTTGTTPQPVFGVRNVQEDCRLDRNTQIFWAPAVQQTNITASKDGAPIYVVKTYLASAEAKYRWDNFDLTSISGWLKNAS
jgi:iron complex outermembrane recepter protein